MAWFSGPEIKSLRQKLEELDSDGGLSKILDDPRHEFKTNLNVDLGLEDLDVELDDLFESLGDTFDSLGDSFDSLLDDSGKSLYDMHDQYTGASKREREREKMRAELAADRERMKIDLHASKSRMKAEKEKMKADMKQMKKDLKKSLPGGDLTTSNINVTGEDGVSISSSNGKFTMRVGNNTRYKHSIVIRDNLNDIRSAVDYLDDKNFTVTNDEFSGSININDNSVAKIKAHIRDDIQRRERRDRIRRPPPPMPQMPPNTSFREHELSPDLDIMAPPFDTEGGTFDEYDKPHQSAPPHTCEPLFVSRTWKGEKGKPVEFDEGAKVTVSGHNAFGRKYEVKINGNAIYVPEIENLMDYCYVGDHLDTFLEMRSPAEKVILLKIIDGLIAMKIAEPHHEGIKELL